MRVIPRGQYIGKLLGDPPKDVAEPLKLRSSGLGSGIGKDDYTVFTREWEIGRIYQTRAGERRCPPQERSRHFIARRQ